MDKEKFEQVFKIVFLSTQIEPDLLDKIKSYLTNREEMAIIKVDDVESIEVRKDIVIVPPSLLEGVLSDILHYLKSGDQAGFFRYLESLKTTN